MSSALYTALLFIHLAGAIVWIGGMVFAHFALRPAAAQVLEPPLRLPLMAATLGRFFRIVAGAVVAILASGALLIARTGMAQAPTGWHVMLALGVVMAGIFAFIHAGLYPRLRQAVADRQWQPAAALLNRIRVLVLANLGLGVVVVGAAVAARG